MIRFEIDFLHLRCLFQSGIMKTNNLREVVEQNWSAFKNILSANAFVSDREINSINTDVSALIFSQLFSL